MRRFSLAGLIAGICALFLVVLMPNVASAHVERPSYWPDPKPDCAVSPCAGGMVPKARSLATALDAAPPGKTRVVCQPDSMERLRAAIKKARAGGYLIRPTDRAAFSEAEATALLKVNKKLFDRCKYDQIQPAVTASSNNDRVVVMPGLYTEPTSRQAPTYDPKCDKYETSTDGGDPGALSHDYQIHCPNDANLIAVIGRAADTEAVPSPPRTERHGIPGVGECIRCNVQLEGSGVGADDVIVEAGDPAAGNGGPSAAGHKKDVGVFVDRADGFVLRNMTIRHAREHAIYVLETDGYMLDRFKTYFAGGYGVLTFVGDHGLIQNCEAAGSGDSGLYPGSGADSTTNRYKPFYPEYRYSQTIQKCDSHHNTGGFSGTNSHGTLIRDNNFYDNALGYTTDVFTAPGHPGFPQHGNVVEGNNFYSNNFNPFQAGSDVEPFIAAPVGTGLWLAGGNQNIVRNNKFWDNWRRGAMLFAVPDATVCGPPPVGSDVPVPGCNLLGISTSFDNHFYGNVMGVNKAGKAEPNGTDFWWDSFPLTTGNCWWSNKAAPGKKVTSSPANLPGCVGGTSPALSIGLGHVVNEAELVACLAGYTVNGYPNGNTTICNWTKTPPKPGTAAAAAFAAGKGAMADNQRSVLASVCQAGLAQRLCSPFPSVLDRVSALLGTSSAKEPVNSVAKANAKPTEGRLSSFTCSWWRKADDDHRLGMVQRIRTYATGPVENGERGAGLSDARAAQLFEERCSTFEAGPFALYKLYGAAAPFAAAN